MCGAQYIQQVLFAELLLPTVLFNTEPVIKNQLFLLQAVIPSVVEESLTKAVGLTTIRKIALSECDFLHH